MHPVGTLLSARSDRHFFDAGLATAASLQRIVTGLPGLIFDPLKGELAKALDEIASDETNNNNFRIVFSFCFTRLLN